VFAQVRGLFAAQIHTLRRNVHGLGSRDARKCLCRSGLCRLVVESERGCRWRDFRWFCRCRWEPRMGWGEGGSVGVGGLNRCRLSQVCGGDPSLWPCWQILFVPSAIAVVCCAVTRRTRVGLLVHEHGHLLCHLDRVMAVCLCRPYAPRFVGADGELRPRRKRAKC
jgi:hypothetical protein